MLRVLDIHVNYGAIRALKGVSLEVNEGEVVALIGANGAGKSTLLRTISGVLRPVSGDITFAGRSVRGMAEDHVVRLGLLQVQEGRGILTRMTVQENLEMGAYCRSDTAEIRQRYGDDFRQISGPARSPQAIWGDAQRRGTANAGHWPCPHGTAKIVDARRAVPGAGAHAGQ